MISAHFERPTTAQGFRFGVAIGILLSLLLGATEGRGADAPGKVTTVLLAEGDNVLVTTTSIRAGEELLVDGQPVELGTDVALGFKLAASGRRLTSR